MRVLLTTIGSFGDLNPYIGLGLGLKRRGHHPVLAVSKFYRDAVEAAGLECRPVRPDGDPSDVTVVQRIMHPLRGADYLIRELLMPRLDEAYEDLLRVSEDTDIIVSHPLTYTAPLVAEMLRRPWVGAVLAPVSFFSRIDPPIVVAKPLAAALHRRWPWLSARAIGVGKLVTRTWGDPVHAMRARLGLPRRGHPMYEGQFSPDLNLALFSRVLAEPQADWPAHTVVTGAVTYDAVRGSMPEVLAAFLDNGPAPVVFTLGSSAVSVARAPQFYEASAQAAEAQGQRAVLLVGGSTANRPAVSSSNTFVADWAPHSELFSRATAVVHQGGAGTMHAALRAGCPTIVVPFAHDQPDNAARVERLGVSRTIYPQQYTAARVRKILGALLSDNEARERARVVADVVNAEGGADTAAEAIERAAWPPRTFSGELV